MFFFSLELLDIENEAKPIAEELEQLEIKRYVNFVVVWNIY